MNDITYGAYRTAMKLRAIQKTTKCECKTMNRFIMILYHVKFYILILTVGAVDLDILSHAFSEYGWEGSTHNSITLSVLEFESLLNKIFQLAQRGRSRFLQPDKCVEITLNWSLGCLDRWANNNTV